MEGRIAVCLNVFNVEETIESVLESLVKQTYKEFYVFLIDNGSTDKTLSLCSDFIRAVTFAGVTWPDIYIFKGETHESSQSYFLERINEILKRVKEGAIVVQDEIGPLIFRDGVRPLEKDEIEKEILRINSK